MARELAFAHGIVAALQRGEFKSCTEVAAHFGLTRARISQILNLTLLAPEIQSRIARLTTVGGREPLVGRDLRPVVRHRSWAEQRELWASLEDRLAEVEESAAG